MVGVNFEDEDTVWEVLNLQWEKLDHADDQLVVYYYDKLAVELSRTLASTILTMTMIM